MIGSGSGVGWRFTWGSGSSSDVGSSFGLLIAGSAVDSCGAEKEPVSIQVSWPEGFLTGLLKNQMSPPMRRRWIVATTMNALRKRGSDDLITAFYGWGAAPCASGRVMTPTLEMPALWRRSITRMKFWTGSSLWGRTTTARPGWSLRSS